MTLILLIATFGLLLAHLSLKERVSKIEEKLKNYSSVQNNVREETVVKTETPVNNLVSVTNTNEQQILSPIPMKVVADDLALSKTLVSPVMSEAENTNIIYKPQTISVSESEEEKEFFLVRWFKENTLIKIGSIVFFLGAVWLVSYAFVSEWISPLSLILLGFVLALSVYIIGYYRQQVSISQYVILTALGTGIVCATIFIAQIISTFFTPPLSLLLLSLSLLYTMYVSWQTGARKLAMAIGMAGLLVPPLVGVFAEPIWLLLYLLVLSIGLLFVALKMELRAVTLLLVLGVTVYEIGLFDFTNPNLLWFFVVIFSVLFFTSVTLSLIKTKKPETLDILSLSIASLAFVIFASEISLSAGLATFLAAVVTSVTGYQLATKNYPLSIAAVYVAFASIFLLVATSFVFAGYTEVLAYIIEITTVFLVATHLGLPGRVVKLIAFCYLLPLAISLNSFGTTLWQDGVWHTDALVLVAMTMSLALSTIWLVQKRMVTVYNWSASLASVFGGVGLFYLFGVIAQFMIAIFPNPIEDVMVYVSWTAIVVALMLYTIRLRLANSVPIFLSFTLALPVLASFNSLESSFWLNGVIHIHGFGMATVSVFLVLTTLLFTQLFCVDYNQKVKRILGLMIVFTIGYIFIVLGSVYDATLPYEISMVAKYMSYMIILYGLVSLFVLLRVNTDWLGKALLVLIYPLILSVSSFSFSGWQKHETVEALGLFLVITILVLLGLGLRRHYHAENIELETKVFGWSKSLFVIASVFAVGYLWSLSHSILQGEKAVTLALFLYTIIGLFLYQYGRQIGKKDFRYAGQLLLTFVFLRLIFVDVWEMELVWRIVTFLGIGILFIGTALLEKPKKTEE